MINTDKGTWSPLCVNKGYFCRCEHLHMHKPYKRMLFYIFPVKTCMFFKIHADLHYILVGIYISMLMRRTLYFRLYFRCLYYTVADERIQ